MRDRTADGMPILSDLVVNAEACASAASRPLVSVVLPLYNEAATLPELLSRLGAVADNLRSQFEFEFVCVDDGSADDTVVLAERLALTELRLVVVALRRNYGQTAALQAGFEQTRGAIVISMDADLQHFPEDIPQFLIKMREGYDVVCGWRADRREGISRRWPSAVANWIIRKLTGTTIHDIGTTFRAYEGDLARQLRLLGEHHRFVPVLARNLGARLSEVPIRNIERPVGTSNYGLSRTFNVLLDIAFVVFYTKYLDRPIRVFGRLALATLAVAMLILAVLGAISVIYGVPVVRERSGWFLLALVLGVSGVQFLLFGLISEVIVRMYYFPGQAKSYLVRKAPGGVSADRR